MGPQPTPASRRRPVLLLALSVLTIEYIIMAMTTSFWLLFTGPTLAGLAGATYATATAYVADLEDAFERYLTHT